MKVNQCNKSKLKCIKYIDILIDMFQNNIVANVKEV